MANVQHIDTSWPVNRAKKFGQYGRNLDIVVTRKTPLVVPAYRSRVQQYIVQFVSGRGGELEPEHANNGQIDFEHLRNVLNDIYDNVMHSYASLDNLLCQINIKLSSLKKKFLKSGLFRADDVSAAGMCDFLINELAVVCNSDEALTVDGQFYVDIIVTRTDNVTGTSCYSYDNYELFKARPKYISNSCKLIYSETRVLLNSQKNMKNLQFLHLLKYGICDLSIIDQSNIDKNCIPLSISLSLLWQQTKFNMKEALHMFVNNFKMNGQILCDKMLNKETSNENVTTTTGRETSKDELTSTNGTHATSHASSVIHENNQSFYKLIEKYCKLLRRNIVVMIKKTENNLDSELSILFIKKHYSQKDRLVPIYLLYSEHASNTNGLFDRPSESHVSVLFEVNLFNCKTPKNKRFCLLCTRQYSRDTLYMHRYIHNNKQSYFTIIYNITNIFFQVLLA